jgi:hypothetical protein
MPMPANNQWITTNMTFDGMSNQTEFVERDLFDNSMQEAVENLMTDHAGKVEADTKEIKDSLILEPTGYPVEVYAIAFAANGRKNQCRKISCRKTKPLGNWCYDLNSDQFLVDCAGHQHLGRFPIGYKARMEGVEGWAVDVPLSLSVIEKRLSPQHQEAFDIFKKKYPEKTHTYSYIQCTGVFDGEE